MEKDEVVIQYDSMIHTLLVSLSASIAEFEQCISCRNFRGAYVLVEKTMQANGISFTPEQDRIAERFFSQYVY
jgi:hypothetical protein